MCKLKFILIGCEDCQVSYATECPTHRMQMIFDKVVLSRAWASLPPQLQIFRLGESSGIVIDFTECSSYILSEIPNSNGLTTLPDSDTVTVHKEAVGIQVRVHAM